MTGSRVPAVTIRRATADDGPAIADVWLASWRATFDFAPGHPDDEVRRWLTETLLPSTETWVAVDAGGEVVAMMALSDTMVEQLYVAPPWIGRGIGRRLLDLARARRPDGLDLYCFAVNHRARTFYEAHGFEAVAVGDGSANEERQPDIRYRWRPRPDLTVSSPDGATIAAVRLGVPDGPPLLLIHGAAADHTTFRVIGPMLASRFDVYAMDRRGRGASGDAAIYAIEREFEDVAAIIEAIAAARGVDGVDVFGHSYGGRCALGAALRTSAVRRVISYEGAPAAPGERYTDTAVARGLADMAAAGALEELLVTFMTDVVGMTDDEMARYRSDPIWPRRVAAAGTIARELLVEAGDDEAGLDALGAVDVPVLQIQGGDSLPVFVDAVRALDARLVDGRVVVIAGAKHAAHHTHPDAIVAAVTDFLLASV